MPAGFREHLGPLHKWREALRKVRRFDHPVVHLDIDVRVVVAVPRGDQQRIPEPLQVGRHRSIARRTDLQITRIIEVELLSFPRIALFDEPIRRQPRWRNTEIEVNALHQRLHVRDMVSLQRRVAQLLRLLQRTKRIAFKIASLEFRILWQVVRIAGDIENDFGRSADMQGAVRFRFHLGIAGHNAHGLHKLHVVSIHAGRSAQVNLPAFGFDRVLFVSRSGFQYQVHLPAVSREAGDKQVLRMAAEVFASVRSRLPPCSERSPRQSKDPVPDGSHPLHSDHVRSVSQDRQTARSSPSLCFEARYLVPRDSMEPSRCRYFPSRQAARTNSR